MDMSWVVLRQASNVMLSRVGLRVEVNRGRVTKNHIVCIRVICIRLRDDRSLLLLIRIIHLYFNTFQGTDPLTID